MQMAEDLEATISMRIPASAIAVLPLLRGMVEDTIQMPVSGSNPPSYTSSGLVAHCRQEQLDYLSRSPHSHTNFQK